jgi:hypothetical protein
MAVSVTTNEEAQLAQTIEMFEVITQSQPLDYQSLEILKEAYAKLGRQKDSVRTSKRIAEAYVQLGQLSSAILEYESILQRFPDDPDVRKALSEIENKAANAASPKAAPEEKVPPPLPGVKKVEKPAAPVLIDDGRRGMHEIFVEGRLISERDFNANWPVVDLQHPPKEPVEPFIQLLADRQLLPLETSLKVLAEKTRLGFLPIDKYDIDVELARSFPRDLCQRWCIVPFDRMSKSILIATANPFNKQVTRELAAFTQNRLLWYLALPTDLTKALRKIFR